MPFLAYKIGQVQGGMAVDEMVPFLTLVIGMISLQERGLLQTKGTGFPIPCDTNLTEKPSILLDTVTIQCLQRVQGSLKMICGPGCEIIQWERKILPPPT